MSMLDLLKSQLGATVVQSMAQQLGGDKSATNKAVAGAIPVLIQAMARNAQGGGADAMLGALERDHDGSILDDLGGFFGRQDTKDGDGILGHVLGNERPQVEQQLSKVSGLDLNKIGPLLAMLAPVVMGAMGKMRSQGNLDAAGLSNALKQEQSRVAAPDLGGLGKMLDMDGDGQYMDDVAKIGSSLLGGLFGKR